MPIFRFAPSPNGLLHLGHAYCALLNARMAQQLGGQCLLRYEDIDKSRCRKEFYDAIERDLGWLGLNYPQAKRYQSQHLADYDARLRQLIQEKLVYPAFLTRGAVRAYIAQQPNADNWPQDPDGAPLYPTFERDITEQELKKRMKLGKDFAWRLNMTAALNCVGQDLYFLETDPKAPNTGSMVRAQPQIWGDVVLARRDIGTSYHLAVVVDDALQQISHVVRGRDLFAATHLHRLLQELFGFSTPLYHHHRLILDEAGGKLSKSTNATALATLREQGISAAAIRDMLSL